MLCVHTGRFCVKLHVFEQDSICVAIVLETKGLLQQVLCRDVPHNAIHTKKNFDAEPDSPFDRSIQYFSNSSFGLMKINKPPVFTHSLVT